MHDLIGSRVEKPGAFELWVNWSQQLYSPYLDERDLGLAGELPVHVFVVEENRALGDVAHVEVVQHLAAVSSGAFSVVLVVSSVSKKKKQTNCKQTLGYSVSHAWLKKNHPRFRV